MESNFQEYLDSPKSIEELNDKIKNENMNWSKEQLELYLRLNKKAEKEDEKWVMKENSREVLLLKYIRRELSQERIIRLDILVDQLPHYLPATKEELYNLAKNADDLYCPNSNVVTKK